MFVAFYQFFISLSLGVNESLELVWTLAEITDNV